MRTVPPFIKEINEHPSVKGKTPFAGRFFWFSPEILSYLQGNEST